MMALPRDEKLHRYATPYTGQVFSLLDAFCSQGGAGMGYCHAGFKVTGVDNKAQPRYPFTFHQDDAFEFIEKYHRNFDVIHASPPCQAYSRTKNLHSVEYPAQLPQLIELLESTGKPYIIENVPGSPMRKDISLSGKMFGLKVIRYRWFQSNIYLQEPAQVRYPNKAVAKLGLYTIAGEGRKGDTVSAWSDAMQINWMTKKGLAQAIPPAYTRWIGIQLINYLKNQ